MTNTNESTNESQAGTTTKDSAFGFLIELTKTPVLFFFVAGLACFVSGILGSIPGIGKVPAWGIPILIAAGVLLMFIPIKDYRRTMNLQGQRDRYKEGYDILFRQNNLAVMSLMKPLIRL